MPRSLSSVAFLTAHTLSSQSAGSIPVIPLHLNRPVHALFAALGNHDKALLSENLEVVNVFSLGEQSDDLLWSYLCEKKLYYIDIVVRRGLFQSGEEVLSVKMVLFFLRLVPPSYMPQNQEKHMRMRKKRNRWKEMGMEAEDHQFQIQNPTVIHQLPVHYTAKLLTSPEVTRSQRLVLQTGRFPPLDDNTAAHSSRQRDGRNLESMIPGYTGFVPLRQNYFCKTYAETCRDALSQFNLEQEKRLHLASAQLPSSVNKSWPDFTVSCPFHHSSLTALLSWVTHINYVCKISSIKAGFTGYVPKARFYFGSGYPDITNKALIQFGKQMQGGQKSGNLQEHVEDSSSSPLLPTIYQSKTGLLPCYTGHIPGYRFQYGHTFGHLTCDALSHTGSQRTKLEESRLN
ncbi:hypothetical protein DNTS_015455 [Danionella cerebrum]|uniref:Ciliary microtubule inner protein 2B n=1 Tax=Danionella cerebrum TaxID=2873325 RepID=A0A553NIS2_9TELE|nr:hypothetical protein DNTS_015455 [Danionella translucida]TRY65310.1 hypothetical protein DNTS_015455 [Danionella translucida]